MAIHARFGRWHSRARRRLDGRMTITAINPVITHVMLMRELNRLIPRHECLRYERRTVEFQQQPSAQTEK
jgi:hypothetical protein